MVAVPSMKACRRCKDSLPLVAFYRPTDSWCRECRLASNRAGDRARREERRSFPSLECDCGGPKASDSVSCARCAWLDGTSEAEAEAIGVLRALGGAATLEQVETFIAGNPATKRRRAYRWMATLLRLGRVKAIRDTGLWSVQAEREARRRGRPRKCEWQPEPTLYVLQGGG